ncbi:MAG TPA: MBL fold metallo-hydrolase, partial [Acidimicrobiales bacterium]|nr:MBL fold metallo-hydrolase [Acidimicrobiales bacterium]
VNTHHHGDHTNGNGLLPPTTTIIGHERCRELMLQAGPIGNIGVWEPVDWGNIKPIPPFVTFQDRLDVHVGDLRVELHHLGPAAHTTNDVVAWIPANKVLFTGDLIFNGGTPFVLMGSVRGSLEALDRLDEFGADVLVPGHGEPCGREAIAAVRSYLTFVWETATSAHAAGESPLEAAKAVDLGDFMDLTDRERIVGNLHRAYAEIEGAAPGELIDLAVAAGDMIAFNGGRPLRCLA